jgi:hypothetical protein
MWEVGGVRGNGLNTARLRAGRRTGERASDVTLG